MILELTDMVGQMIWMVNLIRLTAAQGIEKHIFTYICKLWRCDLVCYIWSLVPSDLGQYLYCFSATRN